MLSYEQQVIEDQNGPICNAQKALCSCADGGEGDIFYVFWPEGSNQKIMDGAASSMYGHGGNDVSNSYAATLHTFEVAGATLVAHRVGEFGDGFL